MRQGDAYNLWNTANGCQWTISTHTVLYIICNTSIIGEITKMKLLMKSDCTVNACSGGVLNGDPEKLNSSLILGLNVVIILDVYRKSWTASLRHRLVQMQQGSSDFEGDKVTHWVPRHVIDRRLMKHDQATLLLALVAAQNSRCSAVLGENMQKPYPINLSSLSSLFIADLTSSKDSNSEVSWGTHLQPLNKVLLRACWPKT